MGTSIKHICKITSHLFTSVGCIAFLLLPGLVFSADSVPIKDEINSLAEQAETIGKTFMQQSFELRMKYEFSGEFLKEGDKNKLYKLAENASNSLQALAEQQQQLKQDIEEYQGQDWDQRYGSTGLWRKLAKDLYKTKLAKCEVDYYLALTSKQLSYKKKLDQLRERIISLEQKYRSANAQLLKAQILTLAKVESDWRTLAMDILDSLMDQPDIDEAIYFRAAIEKLKLSNIETPEPFNSLIRKITKSNCSNNFDLILPLAFLQRRYDPKALEKVTNLWPETKGFLGSLLLSELSSKVESGQMQQTKLYKISAYEAELAALAAWKNGAKDYKAILEVMVNKPKFQTLLVLYVSALAFEESSPVQSINLLIKASRLQKIKESENLNIGTETIAEQAAGLSYNLFAEGVLDCKSALEAFENYIEIADSRIDENLEYLYSVVLDDCGDRAKSKELLEKITGGSTGYLHDRAKLDLITQQLRQDGDKNQSRHGESLKQLRDFISNCHNQDCKRSELCIEAVNIYCQSLLESRDKLSAQKVLAVLEKVESTPSVQLDLFKSKAFQNLGVLDKAVHHMLLAIEDDGVSFAGQVNGLLSEILETIEQLKSQADDFGGMIKNCKMLAEFSYKTLGDRKSTLYFAEFNILAADKERDKLISAQRLLSNMTQKGEAEDVDLLRCRARLLTEQGGFDKAAKLWAKICELQRNEVSFKNQRSFRWWRAKFYELYCCTKMANGQRQKVLHTIDVLQNSFSNIPSVWAYRLDRLKEEIE